MSLLVQLVISNVIRLFELWGGGNIIADIHNITTNNRFILIMFVLRRHDKIKGIVFISL